MNLYQTNVVLAATGYIYADSMPEASALVADFSELVLDVSQNWRFIDWIGDQNVRANVHFLSDMTVLGYCEGASPVKCINLTGKLPQFLSKNIEADDEFAASPGAKRFTVDVLLMTSAYIHAESENKADKRFSKLFSKSISVDDACWLRGAVDPTHPFWLSPRLKFVKTIRPPIEIVDEDDRQNELVERVVSNMLGQARRNGALMKRLKTQAAEMRKGMQNIGWISESMMIETVVRTAVLDALSASTTMNIVGPPSS